MAIECWRILVDLVDGRSTRVKPADNRWNSPLRSDIREHFAPSNNILQGTGMADMQMPVKLYPTQDDLPTRRRSIDVFKDLRRNTSEARKGRSDNT